MGPGDRAPRRAGLLESQNRLGHANFRSYLLGRAAHLRQLNTVKGQALFEEIKVLGQ